MINTVQEVEKHLKNMDYVENVNYVYKNDSDKTIFELTPNKNINEIRDNLRKQFTDLYTVEISIETNYSGEKYIKFEVENLFNSS